MEPLFSIITVTYNAEATIVRTLHSVDEQTCTDYEHYIIDGASKDSTDECVEANPNARRVFISEPDKGLYDAMNKGLSSTKGKYLIFLNSGDKFHSPQTLEKIKKAIEDNDEPGIVYGQTVLVDDEGNKIGMRHLTAPENLTYKSFSKGMLVCHQAFIPLRRITSEYNTEYRFSADYEWCVLCLQHSRNNVYIPDEPLVDYLSEGLTTQNKIPSLIERFRIMAYYYGFFTTVFNHIGFAGRALKRRLSKKKSKQ